MILDSVIPWGRSLNEYRRMFNLTESDLCKAVLGLVMDQLVSTLR